MTVRTVTKVYEVSLNKLLLYNNNIQIPVQNQMAINAFQNIITEY
jgi:hypothetical protein